VKECFTSVFQVLNARFTQDKNVDFLRKDREAKQRTKAKLDFVAVVLKFLYSAHLKSYDSEEKTAFSFSFYG